MDKLLRIKDVKQVTGLSTSTIYALRLKGEFPEPVHISQRAVAWPESVVNEWIENVIKKSEGKCLKS